ncbi:MAG: hypothetical protein GY953_41590 [bacterium]|nr:hypothetical protein [bacterium]
MFFYVNKNLTVVSPYPEPPGSGWVASDARKWIKDFNTVADGEGALDRWVENVRRLTIHPNWTEARRHLECIERRRARALLPDEELEQERTEFLCKVKRDGEIIGVRSERDSRAIHDRFMKEGKPEIAAKFRDGNGGYQTVRTATEERISLCLLCADMPKEIRQQCRESRRDRNGKIEVRTKRKVDIDRRFSGGTAGGIRDKSLRFPVRRDKPVPVDWFEVNSG